VDGRLASGWLGWGLIGVGGQGHAITVDLRADVFDRLEHVPVRAYQDQVAIPSDELSYQAAGTCIAVEVKGDDPLPGRLTDVDQSASADPLPEEKQEGWCSLYTPSRLLVDQERSRMLAIRREEKLETPAGIELQPDGTLVRQYDALDPRPEEGIEPIPKAGQRQVIKMHTPSLRCIILAMDHFQDRLSSWSIVPTTENVVAGATTLSE
jgi:hypothetical protein